MRDSLAAAAFVLGASLCSGIHPREVRAQLSVNESLEGMVVPMSRDGFIPVGAPRQGYTREGETVHLGFALEAGLRYTMVGVCDDACDDFDLILMDARGKRVAAGDDETAYPVLSHRPEVAGRYELQVPMLSCSTERCAWGVAVYRSGGSAGADEAALPETASETPRRTHVQKGTLGPGDDMTDDGRYVDFYTMSVGAGDRLVIDLVSGAFDPVVNLIAPEARRIGKNDDFHGDVSRSVLDFVLSEEGPYVIAVSTYDPGEEGAYALRIEHTRAPTVPGWSF